MLKCVNKCLREFKRHNDNWIKLNVAHSGCFLMKRARRQEMATLQCEGRESRGLSLSFWLCRCVGWRGGRPTMTLSAATRPSCCMHCTCHRRRWCSLSEPSEQWMVALDPQSPQSSSASSGQEVQTGWRQVVIVFSVYQAFSFAPDIWSPSIHSVQQNAKWDNNKQLWANTLWVIEICSVPFRGSDDRFYATWAETAALSALVCCI